jgi:hypothetical protein
MRSLPTQDQIDCLKESGIDVKRLPMAGPAPVIQQSSPSVTGKPTSTPSEKSKPRQNLKPPAPAPVYVPVPPTRSMPDFPVPLVILVLVIVFLMAAMNK